jgi:hypothetical protein
MINSDKMVAFIFMIKMLEKMFSLKLLLSEFIIRFKN